MKQGRVLVRLTEDSMGNVLLSPVSERQQRRIAKTNEPDGGSTVFIQEADWRDWVDTLPRRAFYGRGLDRGFNDGARFLMDEWMYRHFVGGQCD